MPGTGYAARPSSRQEQPYTREDRCFLLDFRYLPPMREQENSHNGQLYRYHVR